MENSIKERKNGENLMKTDTFYMLDGKGDFIRINGRICSDHIESEDGTILPASVDLNKYLEGDVLHMVFDGQELTPFPYNTLYADPMASSYIQSSLENMISSTKKAEDQVNTMIDRVQSALDSKTNNPELISEIDQFIDGVAKNSKVSVSDMIPHQVNTVAAGKDPSAILSKIELRNPKHPEKSKIITGQIDTGAKIPLIGKKTLEELDIPIKNKSIALKGIGAGVVMANSAKVEVVVKDKHNKDNDIKPFQIEVAVLESVKQYGQGTPMLIDVHIYKHGINNGVVFD
jgi:hypothetical protein